MAGKQLQLQNLNVEQLKAIKDQLDGDIQGLSRALDSLRGGRTRFNDSKTYLESFKKFEDGQTMLCPLSSSLYVGGALKDTKTCLVDVGTGYYIKEPIDRAQDFFGKRMGQMQESMGQIGEALKEKQKNQNMVIEMMQSKMQIQQQAEEAEAQQ